ncbi:MAG: hypothetical protein ABIP39_02670 [Polyangiaceae bacterium]
MVVAALAFALSGCSKSTVGTNVPVDAAPPPLPACKASLHVVPVPPDWRAYVVAGGVDSMETTRSDRNGETIFTSDMIIGDFAVRTEFGKTPVPAGPLVVRQRGCAGAEISATPYWSGGPVTLRRSGDVHVLSWRAGGASVDEPLIAFRRD